MIGQVIDTALDRTIIGGYTNVGYRLRRRSWNHGELEPMDGKVVALTGATSGIGLAAAEGFARLGASVWVIARDRERGERARAQIAARTGNEHVAVGICDLSRLASIRSFAGHFSSRVQRLDVLVNDAGVMPATRRLSPDGIELTLATNVIGPFALTGLLTGLLARSAPARIIDVSSGGMYAQRIRVDDLQRLRDDYDPRAVYAHSKRAEVILTELRAQQLASSGVVAHSMHPGWADTPGVRSSLPRFYRATRPLLRTPAQAADTIVWLGAAAEPARSTGRFWHDRAPRPTHLLPWTRETPTERDSLWAQCVALSGRRPDAPAH